MAFQNNAFQANGFQSASSAGAAAARRGRRLAYEPLLHIAIRAGEELVVRARTKLRPAVLTEHRRATRLTSLTARARINSTSTGAQFAFTGAGYSSRFPSDDPVPPPENQPQ